jgi:hypothetical protein
MALTKKQKEIVNFLESLIGERYNIDTLNEYLSNKFGEKIEAEIVNDDDETNTLTDWNIMFNSEKEDTFGYFDIYMLKMRNDNLDGSTFYVTEIGYEFE